MDNKDIKNLQDSFQLVEIPPELDLTIEKAIREGKKQKKNSRLKYMVSAASLVFIMLTSTILFKNHVYFNIGKNLENKTSKQGLNSEAEVKKLPVVGSFDNLTALIGNSYGNAGAFTKEETVKEPSSKDMASYNVGIPGEAKSFSQTNLQVQGVDEADTVKTDGEYIYKVFNFTVTGNMDWGVQIIKATPAGNMSLVKQISIKELNPGMGGMQLFVKNDYLIVIGNVYKKPPVTAQKSKDINSKKQTEDLINMGSMSTAAYIYDMKDKNNIHLVRNIELDGSFTTARMIGSNLYLVGNKYIYKDWLEDSGKKAGTIPYYKDSMLGKDPVLLEFDKISYCPEALEPNYIMIGSLNLEDINNKLKINCSLGSGRNIFCSTDNLYVAGYNYRGDRQFNTTIYKFNLKDGDVNFIASGSVPGNIINQYSMDENNNYFRVATTSGAPRLNSTDNLQNNLYVLDKDMKISGSVEGLAKGERIYSTRFMGDRAYMVTFKNTDPLFAIDLKNPNAPKVLGELKIPGFSNYLHPYDENHIIGIGMDTETLGSGTQIEKVVTKGMKLELFDVSDVNNPKQQFVTSIGDSGTYSEVLNNPKALLFSKEKNLLAFPIQVTKEEKDIKGVVTQTLVTFSGAYVYNIDLNNGFSLRGGITHMTTLDMRSKEYNWNGQISRVLFIDNDLYTISNSVIKANNMNDLKEIGTLKLK